MPITSAIRGVAIRIRPAKFAHRTSGTNLRGPFDLTAHWPTAVGEAIRQGEPILAELADMVVCLQQDAVILPAAALHDARAHNRNQRANAYQDVGNLSLDEKEIRTVHDVDRCHPIFVGLVPTQDQNTQARSARLSARGKTPTGGESPDSTPPQTRFGC